MNIKHRRLKIRFKRIKNKHSDIKKIGRGTPAQKVYKKKSIDDPLKIFFSFDYADSYISTKIKNITSSFTLHSDVSPWEPIPENDKKRIRSNITESLNNCDVVIVLIGKRTAQRAWIRYEIALGMALGKGIIGIHINKMSDYLGNPAIRGDNPFKFIVYKLDLKNNLVRIYEKAKVSNRARIKKHYLLKTFKIDTTNYPGHSRYLNKSNKNNIDIYDWVRDNGEEYLEDWIYRAILSPEVKGFIQIAENEVTWIE